MDNKLVFSLARRARQKTAQLVKKQRYYTPKRLITYMYVNKNKLTNLLYITTNNLLWKYNNIDNAKRAINLCFTGRCLYESGLVPEKLTHLDDVRCPSYGIGLTNMVERTTRGSADLSR